MKFSIKSTAYAGICAATVIAAGYFGVKYALPVLLPFFFSFLISRGVKRMAQIIEKRTRIPKKVTATVIIVLGTAALVFLLYVICETAVKETADVVRRLGALFSDSDIAERLSSVTKKLTKIPVIGKITPEKLGDAAMSAVGKISTVLTDNAAGIISRVPGVVFGFFVGVISLFYFSLDDGGIKKRLRKYLGEKTAGKITTSVGVVTAAVKKFLRAYLTILLVTFGELLTGFLIIGVNNAFLIAALTSVVDILPVLGVGTVIIPWALWTYLTGQKIRALLLLSLMGIIYLVRQFIEPKLVGVAAGVHPLTALVSVWAGWKLIGVGGMILAPLVLNAVSVIIDEKMHSKTSKI